ncbi:MAG: protein-glutamate O-methyltransferase CheR [bacterium]
MAKKNEISNLDFRRLSGIIYNTCGINLPIEKKIFVEGKAKKRVVSLGFNSYDEYFSFLFTKEGLNTELTLLINVLTTNKTDFFREPAHFDFLTGTILPDFIRHKTEGIFKKQLNIWSAGCSTGEEPYTMAILLNEQKKINDSFGFNIYASDISTDVLENAQLGIFKSETVDIIPQIYKAKYLLRSKDETKNLVRFIPEIRSQINFSRINLLENEYNLPAKMDVIFCRNVLIYFDKIIQEKVLTKLTRQLNPEGYLFIGHSETIMGMSLPLERIAPTIYKKNE